MRIAFAGNPNSGKTTMYNALTGKHEHVGNWAGVTRKERELYKKGICEDFGGPRSGGPAGSIFHVSFYA